MARPLRIEYPGTLYHLTSRGDTQDDIFVDDADREEFLSVLGSVVERFDWRLYA
jgi:putative transposase